MKRAADEMVRRLRALHAARFVAAAGSGAASGAGPVVLASAPGRVELAGNHTDHQGGRTLSAAIDRRTWALAVPNGTDELRVVMEGFGEAVVHVGEWTPCADERGTSQALVRGMAAAYARLGGGVRGCDVVTCSAVPVGSGLSSSAAFEVLMGAVLRGLDSAQADATLNPMTLAVDAVEAERTYFGKPCGMQDQLASAHGGAVALDFASDPPCVTPVAFDATANGYALILVDCRCDHSRFADEYAAVPADMFAVARHFGCARLEDVPLDVFLGRLADVRACLGDRSALRALHYFDETRRVRAQQQALETSDFAAFLEGVRRSGVSSAQVLQNVSPHADAKGAEQPAMVVLALCAHLLDASGVGACRIHGGGFGGSVLVFVADHAASSFMASMNRLLGYDACMPVRIDVRGAFVERLA